jgi:hypothetical protein
LQQDGSQFFDANDEDHPRPLSDYPVSLLASGRLRSIFSQKVSSFHRKLVQAKNGRGDYQRAIDLFDNWLTFHFRTLFFKVQEAVDNVHSSADLPVFYPTDDADHLPKGLGIAIFDTLDQPICAMAKLLGFDTIVLQHEIGHHDCVTEIMHTGDYRAALFRVDAIQSTMPPQKNVVQSLKHAKIWFPQEQGIVQVLEEKDGDFVPRLIPIVPQEEHESFQQQHVQLNDVFANTSMEIYVDSKDIWSISDSDSEENQS